jgi:catechol 2,3-dioxygenase-like lactoylglutathione lyase family enzyme
MFSHVMIGSNDIERSKKFYDALFTAIGGREGRVDPMGRIMYMKDGSIFIVTKPINGEPACVSNGFTLGFAVSSPEQAHAWHEAGIAAGGTPIEDDPGIRTGAGVALYLAYLRDPDGNKICAMHRLPQA